MTLDYLQIPRLEATDEDWEELLGEVFEESGLLDPVNGKILRQVPKGLVNLNYDIHVCVHMGTELDPEDSAYPPTAISYPDDTNDSVNASSILHTLVMIDVDLNNKLHWMVTNIPGAKVCYGVLVFNGQTNYRNVRLFMVQLSNQNMFSFSCLMTCHVLYISGQRRPNYCHVREPEPRGRHGVPSVRHPRHGADDRPPRGLGAGGLVQVDELVRPRQPREL